MYWSPEWYLRNVLQNICEPIQAETREQSVVYVMYHIRVHVVWNWVRLAGSIR